MRSLLITLVLCLSAACGASNTPAETPTAEATEVSSIPAPQTTMDGESCVTSEIEDRAEEACSHEVRVEDYAEPADFEAAFPDAENGVARGCLGNGCMMCTDEFLLRADCECGDLDTCADLSGAEWLQAYLGLAPNDDVDARAVEQSAEIERRRAQ